MIVAVKITLKVITIAFSYRCPCLIIQVNIIGQFKVFIGSSNRAIIDPFCQIGQFRAGTD